jgi:hypothetical protein
VSAIAHSAEAELRLPRGRYSTTLVACVIILLGAGLRLAIYLQNRSLWLDEALVSTNITTLSWHTLLSAPPINDQVAPPGFLLGTKLLTTVLGSSERALRLIPLVAGIAGLAAFWYLAQSLLPATGALMALALFALSEPLIYYSNEVKPYGIDAFATTLILIAFTQCLNTRLSWAAILLSISVPWLSYPGGLVVGSSATVLFVFWLYDRDRLVLQRLLIVGVLGLVSVVCLYMTAMRPALAHRGLADYWSGFFPPLPVSVAALQWYYSATRHLFDYSLGALSGVAILASVVGLGSFFAHNRRLFFLLAAPLVATLAVSGLHFYPFANRLLLFLLPVILLAIGQGFVVVSAASRQTLVSATMGVLLLLDPVAHAAENTRSGLSGEEIRPVLGWLQTHRQAGDLIYTIDSTKYAFSFYASRFGFTDSNIQLGACAFDSFAACPDFEKVKNYQRVWVLYSRGDKTTTDFILHQFGEVGRRTDEFHRGRAAVWLFKIDG